MPLLQIDWRQLDDCLSLWWSKALIENIKFTLKMAPKIEKGAPRGPSPLHCRNILVLQSLNGRCVSCDRLYRQYGKDKLQLSVIQDHATLSNSSKLLGLELEELMATRDIRRTGSQRAKPCAWHSGHKLLTPGWLWGLSALYGYD